MFSYTPWHLFQVTSVIWASPGNGIVLTLSGWVRLEQASKWPISNWVLTSTWSAAHGTMFFTPDVLYSGS